MEREVDSRGVYYKVGAHQFLWKGHWTDADLAILDNARELACALFEISLGDDVQFDRRRLGRHADSLGMELTVGPGNLWPEDCNISAEDPRQRQRGLAWHKEMIKRAAELGAVAYCGAIYSRPGQICRRPPLPEELSWAAENLHGLAQFAGEFGIRLAIEPMSRFRLHLINTAASAMQLARMADHPNLRVNLDTYHMITEERDYGQAIRCALPLLWGVHACENDRGVPGGGLVPWAAVFDALSQAEDCVRLMLETYNTGPGGLGFSRGIFRNLCPDPEQFVRQGLAFFSKYVVNMPVSSEPREVRPCVNSEMKAIATPGTTHPRSIGKPRLKR
jgi:D-psicose/D-tagatose/L-ribulose 3-epimerase